MNRKEKQSIQNEPLLNERKSVLWVKYEIYKNFTSDLLPKKLNSI